MKTSRQVIVHTLTGCALSVHWTAYTICRYLNQKYLFMSANYVGLMDSKFWKTNLAGLVFFCFLIKAQELHKLPKHLLNIGLPF